jgi:hypothetical protein
MHLPQHKCIALHPDHNIYIRGPLIFKPLCSCKYLAEIPLHPKRINIAFISISAEMSYISVINKHSLKPKFRNGSIPSLSNTVAIPLNLFIT